MWALSLPWNNALTASMHEMHMEMMNILMGFNVCPTILAIESRMRLIKKVRDAGKR